MTTETPTVDIKRKKAAIDAPRTAAPFLMDVTDPRIILVTDETHYLYNPRVHYPPTPGIGESLAQGQQTKNIIVEKDGADRLLVVDGRQEIISGRDYVAKHAGSVIKVKVEIRKFESEAEAVTIMNKADLSVPDTALVRAQRAKHALRFLGNEEEVGKSFGVSASTIRNWLMILDLAPEVQKLIGPGPGQIPENAARRLASLPKKRTSDLPADKKTQMEVAQEMIQAGATRGKAAQKAVTQGKQGKVVTGQVTGRKMASRDFIDELSNKVLDADQPGKTLVSNILKAVLGDEDARKALPDPIKKAWAAAKKATS